MVGALLHGVLLVLLLHIVQFKLARGSTPLNCQNGGTFYKARWKCICTPQYYGDVCETEFLKDDPCLNPNITVLNDVFGSHSPANTKSCTKTGGCIDFSAIISGWHRLKSPAGNVFSRICSSTTGTTCGRSNLLYILTDVVQQDNANIALYSARLSHVSELRPVCYDPKDHSYPVRILVCASSTLYYIEHTVRDDEAFCIGNKKKCSAGLVSNDGSGYEPCFKNSVCIPKLKSVAVALPVIQQVKNSKSNGLYESLFNCIIQDSFETNHKDGIRYRAMYRIFYHNGTAKTIDGCTSSDFTITPGSAVTVSCNYKTILLLDPNIYGGTLECIVQAKCNSKGGSEYNSQQLASISHSFQFAYRLIDPATSTDASVITPSSPINLCINIFKVPIEGVIEIKVSTKRKALIVKDKIKLMVSTPIGNYASSEKSVPCSMKLYGMNKDHINSCVSIALVNEDEENLIPFGLSGSQLTSKVDLTVSFRTFSSSGEASPADNWLILLSHELTVNLTALYTTEIKDYFHIYSGLYFKAANATAAYFDRISIGKCRVMSVMRSSILPYEIQIKECSDSSSSPVQSGITEVAIRYENYVIRIFSKEGVFSHAIPMLKNSDLPMTADNVPRGITIERTNAAVRIKFDIYGTTIYLWRFALSYVPSAKSYYANECVQSFIMTRRTMSENTCTQKPHFQIYDYDSMDMMIVPSFYDTPDKIDGIMFRPDRKSWKPTDLVQMNSQKDLFSANFVAPPVIESPLKPTKWMNFCTCSNSPSSVTDSSICMINAKRASMLRRPDYEASLLKPSKLSNITDAVPSPSQSPTITIAKATAICGNFIQAMNAKGKALIVEECSKSSGILKGADYITQFKALCVQYAKKLNTFRYTETIFNSISNRCLMSLNFNVSLVQKKPRVLQQLQEELCPRNCSGNGVCFSGACQCRSSKKSDLSFIGLCQTPSAEVAMANAEICVTSCKLVFSLLIAVVLLMKI